MKAAVGELPRTKSSEEAYRETAFWSTFVVQLTAQMVECQFSGSYSSCSQSFSLIYLFIFLQGTQSNFYNFNFWFDHVSKKNMDKW